MKVNLLQGIMPEVGPWYYGQGGGKLITTPSMEFADGVTFSEDVPPSYQQPLLFEIPILRISRSLESDPHR